MTLESLALLPELQKIPTDEATLDLDSEGQLMRIADMDRDHFSIELSAAVETPLISLFDARNVSDVVRTAHDLAFSNSDLNLHDHYLEVVDRGEQSVTGFISNLKGKVAELEAPSLLAERFPNYEFTLASDPTQPIWDIRGVGPEDVQDLLVQVKFGSASYAPQVLERMEETPNVLFAVGQEIYNKILEASPELSSRLVDLEMSAYELTAEVTDDLGLLADNFGIDVPDSVGAMLPYVAEVVLGIKLIMIIVQTEREYEAIDREDRNREHVLRTLALLSRFGITTVCVSLGGAAGTSLPLPPGVGPATGAIAGGALAFYLNRRLKPRMLEVAMRVANVDEDDLFYFRNKVAIDQIGRSLAATKAA